MVYLHSGNLTKHSNRWPMSPDGNVPECSGTPTLGTGSRSHLQTDAGRGLTRLCWPSGPAPAPGPASCPLLSERGWGPRPASEGPVSLQPDSGSRSPCAEPGGDLLRPWGEPAVSPLGVALPDADEVPRAGMRKAAEPGRPAGMWGSPRPPGQVPVLTVSSSSSSLLTVTHHGNFTPQRGGFLHPEPRRSGARSVHHVAVGPWVRGRGSGPRRPRVRPPAAPFGGTEQ